MKLLLAVLLSLSLSAPASANEMQGYEYVKIDVQEPKSCTAPCEVEWELPLKGIPTLLLIKQCPGGPFVTRDRHLTTYASGANLPGAGTIRVLIGDNYTPLEGQPSRTQTFCARIFYIPLHEGDHDE